MLDAVARTLRLDGAERQHLYRLADVPDGTAGEESRERIAWLLAHPEAAATDHRH